MKHVLAMLILVGMTGCSWFSTTRKEVEIQPPPKVTHIAQQKPKKMQRELGSLWSDDSQWNQMYSPTQTRVPGDIVTVKLDKKFLSRLEQAIQRPPLDPMMPSESGDSQKDKSAQKDKGEASKNIKDSKEGKESAMAPTSSIKPPEVVEVTIVEALPRGVYRVAANHGIKPAADSPFVYIQGMLREREIASDDTANSDSLLDLKFESIYRDMKVTTYEEGEAP